MRVVSGKSKGHKLISPEGLDVRPTLERVKESVFSALLPYIDGAVVLDLFSGSGALGIEALSRGAEKCDFVDSSRHSIKATKENLRFTKLEHLASVHFSDWKRYISFCKEKYDVVFLDPPYSKGIENEVMLVLSEHLKDDGIVVLETEQKPCDYQGFELVRQAKYGRVFVSFYKKTKNNEV